MAIGTRPTSQSTTDQATIITAPGTQEDPITGVTMKTDKFQAFSWTWVWMSLGSFLVAMNVLLLFPFFSRTAHGGLLIEVILNVLTYYLGAFMVGVVSPKVRIMEPAVAAVIAVILVHSAGMWVPTYWMPMSLGKIVILGAFVFCVAWAGAVHGEKFTRQV